MYCFDKINRENFFLFDKELIKRHYWAKLPQASKGVYPVIACFSNKDGFSFPGEKTVAILSGQTEKTTRDGINGLCGFPGIKIEKYITARGRYSKRFSITHREIKKGRFFPFHRSIIDGGNWCQLLPSAQALYPVMRCFAFHEPELYQAEIDEDGRDDSTGDVMADFISRKFDFCESDPEILCNYAGITYRTFNNAIQSLFKCDFIEESKCADNDYTWKVYLDPPRFFKRDFLNEEISKRYKSKQNQAEEKITD